MLRTPVFVKLGEISYAFYLVHLLVIASVASLWPDGHPRLSPTLALGLGAVAFVLAFGVAWALHEFVETPARRWLVGRRGRSSARSASTV